MKPQILYLFDPLCGWCYGFSSTIVKFWEKHRTEFEFVPIPGGMVTDEKVKPISEIEDFISNSLEQVEKTTGCTFGDDYKNGLLKSKTTMMDSEKPSRALVTFRTFNADLSIQFASELQKAHYFFGRDYNDESLYEELATRFGLEANGFMERYREIKMIQHVQQEFAWVRESGVQGFPTVVLRKGEKYYLISNGYQTIDQLDETLKKAVVKI